MYRKALENLKTWKNDLERKPMMIHGARQVGKTWLMKYFGEHYYNKVAYINFDNNKRMSNLFEIDFDLDRILVGLSLESNMTIDQETLIIFDEIQEVPKALTALKYFNESGKHYHIISAGSRLGVALKGSANFPVGKVEMLDLYPLDFEEFLMALNEARLLELLQKQDFDLIQVFKSNYEELLKLYYIVGGMPEVVAVYKNTSDLNRVRKIQEDLISAYERDFSKYAPTNIVPRLRMLWESLPAQLAKENKKFIYGKVKEGARAKDYEQALNWLIDAGLMIKVSRISKPGMPLSHYKDLKAFKLYVHDVGLLGAMSQLDIQTVLNGSQVFVEFKGALTEQFVLQQLKSIGLKPYYWSAEKSNGEIDFLIQVNQKIVPIEVKASENLQAKSLKLFVEKYPELEAIRLSLSNYRKQSWMQNIPLYLTGQIVHCIN